MSRVLRIAEHLDLLRDIDSGQETLTSALATIKLRTAAAKQEDMTKSHGAILEEPPARQETNAEPPQRQVAVAGHLRTITGRSFKPWVQARTYLIKFTQPGVEAVVARLPVEDVDLFIHEAEDARAQIDAMLEAARQRKAGQETEAE